MRDRLFFGIAAAIVLITFAVSPVIWILFETGTVTMTDIGDREENENEYTGAFGFLNVFEDMKTEIKNIYVNFIPFYGTMTRLSSTVSRTLTSSSTDFLKAIAATPGEETVSDFLSAETETADAVTTDLPAAETDSAAEAIFTLAEKKIVSHNTSYIGEDSLHRFYRIDVIYDDGTESSCMESAIKADEKNLREKMKTQISHFNRIAASSDDVNFFLYIESRFQDCEDYGNYIEEEPCVTALRDEFLASLDDKYTHTFFDVDTMEKRLAYTYKTDPHWTSAGIYIGYCQLIDMISSIVLEIGKPVPFGDLYEFPDITYYGSNSRRISYRGISDPFSVVDYRLPEHTMTDQYQVKDFYKQLEIYTSENYSKDLSTDHYETFYPRAKSVTYPGNKTGRNILLICDSYMWAGAELLASNFDSLYLYYPWEGVSFDFNGFIEKNGVTDVLVMQFSDRLMFNIYGDCKLSNIETR
ncbi:MAG: hypothetical protein ACYCWE_15885 [Eubacteriales bacterium]